MRTRLPLPISLLLILGGANASSAQTSSQSMDFAFDDHPTVRLGDVATIEGFAKLQLDWRQMDHSTSADWDLRLLRAGVMGHAFKRIEYQVERELDDDTNPWRDVYVDVSASSALQVRGGKFKMPFSLDRLTSPMEIEFVYRSLAASSLAPGRDVGVMVHGREFSRIEHLLIRVPTYGPGGTTPTLKARVLNRAGQPMNDLQVEPSPVAGEQQIDLPLASMPPGEYVVEIRTGEQDGDANELFAFRVTG